MFQLLPICSSWNGVRVAFRMSKAILRPLGRFLMIWNVIQQWTDSCAHIPLYCPRICRTRWIILPTLFLCPKICVQVFFYRWKKSLPSFFYRSTKVFFIVPKYAVSFGTEIGRFARLWSFVDRFEVIDSLWTLHPLWIDRTSSQCWM